VIVVIILITCSYPNDTHLVASRGWGQPGHVPPLERVVPWRTKRAKINRVNSEIKRRAKAKLQCRCHHSIDVMTQYFLVSTATIIVWTHQLYSCHNMAAACRLLSHRDFHNAFCIVSATSTMAPNPYSSSGVGSWVVLRHHAAAAACACRTVYCGSGILHAGRCSPD